MIFDESDIDFIQLSSTQFEELCFDLLLEVGYQNLTWRQGGADNGRDIEGTLPIDNPILDAYEEKWLIECKCWEKGVPPAELNSKIAWADAERPDHLLFIVSSYLTNPARNWLKEIKIQKPYKIHLIEGKTLRKNLIRYPGLIEQHLLDTASKILLDARKYWLISGLIPTPEMICYLVNTAPLEKVSARELSFLWCVAKLRSEDIDTWILDNEPFYLDSLFFPLKMMQNTSDSVLKRTKAISLIQLESGINDWELTYPKYLAAQIALDVNTSNTRLALYSFVRDSEGEGIEILIEATSNFPTAIRHIQSNARDEQNRARTILMAAKP